MKKLFVTLGLLGCACTLLAHPGIGIVQDSRGNIYYTDLFRVWKIAPDGKRTVAVPNVHTHELYMDAKDNLFGEHLWYNGEAQNTWGSYAWCLHPNGKLDTVRGPVSGFLQDYSFCRDSMGNQYWAERWTVSRIVRRSPGGKTTILARGKFHDIRWMYATPGGTLYFIDLLDLYRIDPRGNLKKLVTNLAAPQGRAPAETDRHSIFGLWSDRRGNLYAAIPSETCVKKIRPDGSVSTLLHTQAPWSPSGGLIDRRGQLWLLEFNASNDVRVRVAGKIDDR